MKTPWLIKLFIYTWIALLLPGCAAQVAGARQGDPVQPDTGTVDVEITLQTGMMDGRMAFIGVGGEIDGMINPDLHIKPGDTVRLVLLNGDGMQHDLALPDLNAHIPPFTGMGESGETVFEVAEDQAGAYPYFCTVLGHRQAGMEGTLIVDKR
jgi:nitrite reductase (NO-forming)